MSRLDELLEAQSRTQKELIDATSDLVALMVARQVALEKRVFKLEDVVREILQRTSRQSGMVQAAERQADSEQLSPDHNQQGGAVETGAGVPLSPVFGAPPDVRSNASAASSTRANNIPEPMLASSPDRLNNSRGCACRFANPKRRSRRENSSLTSPSMAAAVLSIVAITPASRMNHRVDGGNRSTIHRIRSLT